MNVDSDQLQDLNFMGLKSGVIFLSVDQVQPFYHPEEEEVGLLKRNITSTFSAKIGFTVVRVPI